MKRFLIAALLASAATSATAQQAPTGLLGVGLAPGGSNPLSSIPGIGGLLGGGDRARESTQQMHYLLNKVDNAARLAQLVKSNENWLLQLAPMGGSLADGFIRDFMLVVNNMRQTQEEAAGIMLDPTGAGAYEPHRQFRQAQLERDMEYLESVALRMEAVNVDSQNASQTVSSLAARNQTVEGGLAAQQVSNEFAAVQSRQQQQVLATLQDMLRWDIEQRARETEEKRLSHERHCAFFPESGHCQ